MGLKDHSKGQLRDELVAVNRFLSLISEKHNVSFTELLDILGQKSDEVRIPTCILRNRKLGVLEAVCKYLKEERNLRYSEIAKLLSRDDRVIWVSYRNAAKKSPDHFSLTEPNVWLPTSIFSDAKTGLLERMTLYLKDEANLSFSEIASMLNRDNRTIWSSYHNAKRK